jgi:carbohydrate-binding DOMON domain-containing protein
VPYFGVWADETADFYGKRDAMAVLAEAAGRCFDDDVRQRQELVHALEYLTRETSRAVYVARFRKALDEPNPVIRFRAANDAYKALARRIGSI